jgi:hypothetical protein
MCSNDAVYYDNSGTGYCLGHWHGEALSPGMDCAQLMCRSFDSVKGGKFSTVGKDDRLRLNNVRSFWVVGTTILDVSSWRYDLKPITNLETVYTFRKGLTHKPARTHQSHLLPIRSGMPKVRLYTFDEVFNSESDPSLTETHEPR